MVGFEGGGDHTAHGKSLQAGAARGPYFTDSVGRFSVPLGSGAFLLTAEKRGYAMAAYGQKRWNTPGTPVVLDRDSHFTV